MSNNEKLAQMMHSAELNEERVKAYIQRKQDEREQRTIAVYARAVYEAMDNLAEGSKARRDELIGKLFDAVKTLG